MPHRTLLKPLVLLLIVLWPVAGVTKSPEAVIEETFRESLNTLLENHEAIAEDPSIGESLIDEVLSPRVHFELMSRLILGRHWRDADDEQRERFIAAFQENVIRTYSRMLADNIDEALDMVEGRRADDILRIDRVSDPDQHGRVTVRTTLRFDGTSVPVQYRMIETESRGWLAYDVVIENISFVTNYRQEYGSAIRRDGVEGLITRLEERNERRR
ncbi:MlaC/ttg2D family ABC transporter substrate-binding protein [Aquisalimonas asiatica]|uniref:Phospholipid transport system substrate-binding protein n=1 Tax=Aquisalimonas asiatica TaxID=406100 RepID=A0A1H8VHH5_9GAMM|nr:ABC transporter substrate-binding protein [Aquisalimonas asiatica]SEP14338.1 phospholipid transport system substrate-binding protein [Aquisalimonas asiatica]